MRLLDHPSWERSLEEEEEETTTTLAAAATIILILLIITIAIVIRITLERHHPPRPPPILRMHPSCHPRLPFPTLPTLFHRYHYGYCILPWVLFHYRRRDLPKNVPCWPVFMPNSITRWVPRFVTKVHVALWINPSISRSLGSMTFCATPLPKLLLMLIQRTVVVKKDDKEEEEKEEEEKVNRPISDETRSGWTNHLRPHHRRHHLRRRRRRRNSQSHLHPPYPQESLPQLRQRRQHPPPHHLTRPLPPPPPLWTVFLIPVPNSSLPAVNSPARLLIYRRIKFIVSVDLPSCPMNATNAMPCSLALDSFSDAPKIPVPFVPSCPNSPWSCGTWNGNLNSYRMKPRDHTFKSSWNICLSLSIAVLVIPNGNAISCSRPPMFCI